MNLTPEQMDQGRRNFLKVLAGTPAVAALGAAAALRGPVPGGPVRVGFIGVGSRGRTLLTDVDPAYAQVRAFCDINPSSLQKADEVLQKNACRRQTLCGMEGHASEGGSRSRIMAPPLWAHADLATGCLEAGKHVLCEKMMAVGRGGLRADARRGPAQWQGARVRLPAQLQPALPFGIRGRYQDRHDWRDLPRANRLAPQRQLEAQGRPALTRLRSLEVGLPDVRPSVELASVLQVPRKDSWRSCAAIKSTP